MPPGIPYPDDNYGSSVKMFCAAHDVKFIPWGILWGSTKLGEGVEATNLSDMAEKIGVTKHLAFYAYLQEETFLDGCEVKFFGGIKTPQRMPETVVGLYKVRRFLRASENNKAIGQSG